ncbi:MAG: cytochrome c [Gammaproteobacteria bacterium]|nr:MAG: cytochrome c [Gammaproteobacteria bacterium]
MMKRLIQALSLAVLVCAGAGVFVFSGLYNVAADQPHWTVTTRVLASIRERSIAVRAAQLSVPNLADPALIALGAGHYPTMCSGCHLAPGMADSEIRRGLNPQPPSLTEPNDRSPAQKFWVIKHGIRMSGMPAWGPTHDDQNIWGLVAFVRQLPALDAAGYATLTNAAADDSHEQHDHGSAAPDTAGAGAAGGPSAEGGTMDDAIGSDHAHTHPANEDHEH